MPDPRNIKSLKKKKGKGSQHLKPPDRDTPPDKLQYVSFSFRHLQLSYHIADCDNCDKIALLERMAKLCCLTWYQVYSAERHGFGTETIRRSSIRPTLPSVVTPETTIIAFRFSGLKPMVGFRTREIFQVLFLDHDRTVYDHGN